MTIQKLMADRFPSVPLTRKDIAESFAMDWSKVTDDMIVQLAFHGAKQKANDGLGDKEFTAAERQGIFRKACDAIQNNIWGASRESDPVARELRQMAVQLANAWAKKNAPSVKAVELPKHAGYKAEFNRLMASPKLRERAETRVAELAELTI